MTDLTIFSWGWSLLVYLTSFSNQVRLLLEKTNLSSFPRHEAKAGAPALLESLPLYSLRKAFPWDAIIVSVHWQAGSLPLVMAGYSESSCLVFYAGSNISTNPSSWIAFILTTTWSDAFTFCYRSLGSNVKFPWIGFVILYAHQFLLKNSAPNEHPNTDTII